LTAGGEAFYGPASTAMIAAFHKKTRAIALSIHQSAVYFGPMLAAYFGVIIGNAFGWRAVFFFFGGLGVLLGILLMFRLRKVPATGDTDTEMSESLPENEPPPEKIPFWSAVRQIVRIPTVLLLTVGFLAIVFVNNAYLTFAPTYIEQRFEVSHFVASFYGMSMHFIAAFIGVIIGGVLADVLVTRWSQFRLVLQTTVMFLGAPMVFLIGYVGTVEMLWVVLFLFGLFRGLYESNTHAAIFDVVPPKLRAMVVGLMILVAMGIGSFSPTLFGYLGTLYANTEGYTAADGFALAFQLTSVVWLLGGLCVLSALLFTFKKDRLCED
jgi:MFS family permease